MTAFERDGANDRQRRDSPSAIESSDRPWYDFTGTKQQRTQSDGGWPNLELMSHTGVVTLVS